VGSNDGKNERRNEGGVNRISGAIVDEVIRIHTRLGPGLLESVYEVVLARMLEKRGLQVECQVPVPLVYDGIEFEQAFRADIVVNGSIILEIKPVERLTNAHRKQLLTYLKLADMRLGLLLNFAETFMKNGIVRTVNALPE